MKNWLTKSKMNLIYGSCFIVTITLGFSNAAVQEIPLYTGVLYTGNKTIVTIAADGNCTNLPELFQNNIKSTNIFAPCVQFYDGLDCSGKGIQLHPSSPYQSNLEIWRIHNKTMSLGNCRDSCIPSLGNSFEHLKAVQENKATNHDIPITIYSKPAYHGKEFKIQISGCTFLKHTHIYYTTFRSVRLPKGSCFLVFLGNNFVPPGGTGDPNDCFVTDAFNVLKFQDGMSGLHSFTDFVPSPNSSFIQKKYVKALSPCQCKSSEIVEPELNLTSGRGCIELYSEYRFVGRTIRIPLNFTGCMNFADSKYSEWEGIAYSMKTGAESCVELYSEGDCQGPTHLVVTLPFEIPSLSGYNLLGQIRSIQVCKYDSEHPMNVSKVRVKDGKYQMALYCLLPVAIIGVVTSIVLMMFLWHNKKALNKRSKLSEHEIELFFNGAELHHERTISQKNTQVDFLIQNQPYKYELEILPHRIKFDNKSLLEIGEVGNVYKGELIKGDEIEFVAIKTTDQNSCAHDVRALLKEIKTRMFVGQHPNIIELMGCSTMNLNKGELWILLENFNGGLLEQYLKNNRASFVNNVHQGQIKITSSVSLNELDLECQDTGTNYMMKLPKLDSPILNRSSENFDIKTLIKWSVEIADGMEYLASKKIIHGSLCLKNIFLGDKNDAKLYNFGLSRTMCKCKEDFKDANTNQSWRWDALESLKKLEFSSDSDIWSYGILLWEIFTLGEQPYPGVSSLTNNFILNLEQGLRPTMPPFAMSDIYNIMSKCWDENPKLRPTFTFSKFVLQNVCDVNQSNDEQNQ